MDLRRLVRGTIPWEELEAVALELLHRYERDVLRIEFLDADNWLSTPCVVDDEWFVKILTPQNALVHALFTGARNLGAVTTGREGFFEHFESPYQMAKHELEATKRMRRIGLNAPAPIEAFEVDGFAVLILEYLPAYRTLEGCTDNEVARWSPTVFAALHRMHDHELAHGDVRAENVLIYEDDLYFIDATSVNPNEVEGAMAYDIASALAVIVPRIGVRPAVTDAITYYTIAELMEARKFLDIVRLRPDHEFDASAVKGEIEKRASRRARTDG